MATMLTTTINSPAAQLTSRNSEVRWLEQAIEDVRTELGRGSGKVTSGTAAGKGSCLVYAYRRAASGACRSPAITAAFAPSAGKNRILRGEKAGLNKTNLDEA